LERSVLLIAVLAADCIQRRNIYQEHTHTHTHTHTEEISNVRSEEENKGENKQSEWEG